MKLKKVFKSLVHRFHKNYLGELHWAHGVNTSLLLQQALKNKNIHIIEGDLILKGRLLLMGHSSAEVGNMQFLQWFRAILSSGKIAKIDLKNPEALSFLLSQLKKNLKKEDLPVFINADLIRGPGGKKTVFNSTEFINTLKINFPQVILSIGWTTELDSAEGYSDEMIKEIFRLADLWGGAVSFCLRCCYVDVPILRKFKNLNGNTLTFWNNEDLSAEKLNFLKNFTDKRLSFYDLIFPQKPKPNNIFLY